jgi:hypothetical protein
MPAMVAPAIAPALTGFRIDVDDAVEFDELFVYVGDSITLSCSAAPSCQTHWLTEKLPRS